MWIGGQIHNWRLARASLSQFQRFGPRFINWVEEYRKMEMGNKKRILDQVGNWIVNKGIIIRHYGKFIQTGVEPGKVT